MNRPKNGFRDSTKFNAKPWIIFGVVLAVAVLSFMAFRPMRQTLADKYLESGERKLAEMKYLEAKVEFEKCQWLESGKADEAIGTINQMQNDIRAGKKYFRQYQNIKILDAIAAAEKIPESESEGLKKAKALIESGQPQLAEIIATTLIEMDDNSIKGWAFLGIARYESARQIQMTSESQSKKLSSAKEALTKAIELDPEDKITAEYLAEVNKLLKSAQ